MVKLKRGERDGVRREWLIRAHTQNIGTLPFNYNNTTQDEKKTHETFIDESKGAETRRRLRRVARKTRINNE